MMSQSLLLTLWVGNIRKEEFYWPKSSPGRGELFGYYAYL